MFVSVEDISNGLIFDETLSKKTTLKVTIPYVLNDEQQRKYFVSITCQLGPNMGTIGLNISISPKNI